MTEYPIRMVPLTEIAEPSHRLRESIDASKLGDLADDIAANGLHQAIGLRPRSPEPGYEIIFGHRRFLAHQLLGRSEIAGKIYPADVDVLQAAVAENEQREQLTPYEQALIVQRYVDRGEPLAAIARYLRRSDSWVRDRLELLTWPAELREAVHAGTLGLAVARALADVDHAEYRASLLDEATRTGATARVVEVWRAHYLADRERITVNHMAVEEIAGRREAWKLVVPCDLCAEDKDYPSTRALRICTECHTAILALVEAEAARAGAGAGAG
jgi:ParB family chromosome partitioning protein